MAKIFIVSDTWFNRIQGDDETADVVGMNNHIIDCWNDDISRDDKVYVLGGFGIGDLYHIVVRLNGEIHFLNNYMNDEERGFINEMKSYIDRSSDEQIREKIIFEDKQIMVLPEIDSVLSYLPLSDWYGKSTGTYCFHGLNEYMNIDEHNISCNSKKWNYLPVNVMDVQDSITSFKENK